MTDSPGTQAPSWGWLSGPRAFVAYVLCLVAGFAAEGRLNDALSTMNLPGRVSGTFSDVNGASALWSPSAPLQTLTSWRGWDQARIGVDHGIHVVPTLVAMALIDVVLLAWPGAMLLRSATRATARRYPPTSEIDGEVRRSDLGSLAKVAGRRQWPIVLAAAIPVRDALIVGAAQLNGLGASVMLRFAGLASLLALLAVGVAVILMAYAHLAAFASEAGLRSSSTARESTHTLRRIGRVIVALRIQIVVASVLPAILLALGGDMGEQIDDLAFRWPSAPWTLLGAIAGAVALHLLIRATGGLCWRWYDAGPDPEKPRGSGRFALVAGAALLIGYGVSYLAPAPWSVLLWPGLALFGVGLVSVIEGLTTSGAAPVVHRFDDTSRALWTVRVLAGIPLAALGFIGIRAGVQLLVLNDAFFSVGTVFLACAAATLVLCWFAVGKLPELPAAAPIVAGVGCTAVAVAGAIAPIPVGQGVGALAILFAFSGILCLILVALVRAVHRRQPSAPLALLRLQRVPVLTFLALWLVVTSAVEGTDHYHDVRLLGSSAPPTPVTASAAVAQWLAQNAATPAASGGRTPVPMLFVASFGGGIRSAYWTDLVLDCLFDPGAEPVGIGNSCPGAPLNEGNVFAESGVSGGAVGIAVHRALGSRPFSPALSEDFVSPDIAAMVFRDAWAFWIPTPLKTNGYDRAAVMEQSWERATGDTMSDGLYASAWQTPSTLKFPLTVFNSATIDDGCRLNASVLDAATKDTTASSTGCFTLAPFAPVQAGAVGSAEPDQAEAAGTPALSEPVLAGTKDLYDYLCTPGDPTAKHDISLSSAALLAARFPYISPTGGLTGCSAGGPRTFTMDGGVIDDSGLSTLAEIWSSVAGQIADYDNDPAKPGCVEPRLLIINNGYANPAPVAVPSQPQELIAPALGDSAVGDARTARDEQAAALEFEHAFGSMVCRGTTAVGPVPVPTRVALIEPSARPGPFAPLGWSLSPYATADLADQLGSKPNQCEFAVVRNWFAATPPDPFAPGGACASTSLTSAGG